MIAKQNKFYNRVMTPHCYSFNFDCDHLHKFFISRTARNTYDNTIKDGSRTLQSIFPLEKNQYLFMHFDFGDDWVFKITRSRTQAQFSNKATYPRIVEHIGKNPEQYPIYEENN